MMLKVCIVVLAALCLVTCGVKAEATSTTDMVDALTVDHLASALYDLPPSAFRLTKFEQNMAAQAEHEEHERSLAEMHTAVEAEAEVDLDTDVDMEPKLN
jgi:hypothetical protein